MPTKGSRAHVRLFSSSDKHLFTNIPASGSLVVGSRTAPAQEVIEHGRNGLLVDFFDPVAMARTLVDALESPQAMAPLRAQARQDVAARYSFAAGEQAYRTLIMPLTPQTPTRAD